MTQADEVRTELSDWQTVRDELLAMSAHDLRIREELAADGSLYRNYNPTMQAVHDANAARLAHLLDRYGWPGEYQVGHQAAIAAWLIVQHAIAQPAFQRRALDLLREAVRQGSAPAVHAAMLEDRILTLEGRPQLWAAVAQTRERPPADWAARQREMEAWCRSVGWRD